MRIALIFDNQIRPDTTGVYCLRALQELAVIEHYRPTDLLRIPREGFDLYLNVDDGLRYRLPPELHPCAWWAIDTHLDFPWYRRKGHDFDFLFAAQRDGAAALRDEGLAARWLPLACDPHVHCRHDVPKTHDVCFVGNLFPGPRVELLQLVRRRFPNTFVGRRYFGDLARTYSASRLVFNRSIRNDVNMRVFEALACGSLLVTNDLSDNGQAELFRDGEHLATYGEEKEMVEKMTYYLEHPEERERIAAAGRAAVLEGHTYRHRMQTIVETLAPKTREVNASLTSIIIVTHNELPYTRQCVDSIRRGTDEEHELIFVDNGSSDGTADYLQSLPGATVIVNTTNRGFPAAANQGLRVARGGQMLLLNNDTVTPAGWLRRLLSPLAEDPRIGLVGPCSNAVSGPQQIPVSYRCLEELDDFAQEWAKAHLGERADVGRLVGFCLLLRRELLDRIGYLDERFGVGCFEDDDYCRRAVRAGYRAVIARDAFLHHFGSRTFRGSGLDLGAILRRNEELFQAKWAPTEPVRHLPAETHPPAAKELQLSLCTIVRDNVSILAACLNSIRPWVDEMIVVDTGSRDDTPQLAERLGARVFSFPWCDDFSAARNESLRHARSRWLFWMDSDDVIDEENGRKLRALADRDAEPNVLGYVLQVHCPGPGAEGTLHTTVVDHVKLLRNLPGIAFEGRIHEQVLTSIRRLGGEVAWSDVFVVHAGYDHSPEGQARKRERDLRLLHLEHQERGDHPFTLFNLGMTYANLGRYPEAIDYLQRSIARATPGESHLRKAFALLVSCHQQLGNWEAAWIACQEALRGTPADAELRFRAALLLHESGRLREAARTYEELLTAPPERCFSSIDRGITGYKARQNLAIVYQELGDWQRATEQWRQVVHACPSYRAGWRGLVEALLRQGEHHEAEALLKQGDESGPPGCEKWLLRGQAAAARGDLESARAAFEQAVTRYADDETVWQALCRFRFDHGRPEETEQALKELLRRQPGDASAHHNLGTVYLRLGRPPEAVEAFRHSLRLRPHAAATAQLLELAVRQTGAGDSDGRNGELDSQENFPQSEKNSVRGLVK